MDWESSSDPYRVQGEALVAAISGSGFRVLQVKLFTMAFSPRQGGFDDEPLREFIADKQVHAVESWHFVYEGTPYCSAFVCYTLSDSAPDSRQRSAPKADRERWRKLLTDRDWPVFNRLREWRKAKASEEGIPPYLVFTNQQLTREVVKVSLPTLDTSLPAAQPVFISPLNMARVTATS